MNNSSSIRVTEIYRTLEGEAGAAGRAATFIRLTGCPLRCVWCDAPHAFAGGRVRTVGDVVEEASVLGLDLVTVTGGEPLAQKATPDLCEALLARRSEVRLETSGTIDIRCVAPPVRRIVDFKAPGSGECERNLWENLAALVPGDEAKVVVADRADFDWAVAALERTPLPREARFVQAAWGIVKETDLARWILETRAPVRLGVQLNKFLGLP